MKLLHQVRWLLVDPSIEARNTRRVLQTILLVGLLATLFWYIPIGKVTQAMLQADPVYLTAGILLAILGAYLTALELYQMTKKQGIAINPQQLLEINLAIKFYLIFLPGSLVGSGIRWYRLSRDNGKTAESLAAVAYFRIFENFLDVSIGFVFWFAGNQMLLHANSVFLGLGLILGAAIWVAFINLSQPINTWLGRRTSQKQLSPFINKILAWFLKFLKAVADFRHLKLDEHFYIFLFGIASFLINSLSGLMLARAVGIQIGYFNMTWISAVIGLATQIPLAFAGGFGIREVTVVALLGLYHIPPEIALAFSLFLYIRGVTLGFLGGILELVRNLVRRQTPDPPLVL